VIPSAFIGQVRAPSLAHGLNGASSGATLTGFLRSGLTHMYAATSHGKASDSYADFSGQSRMYRHPLQRRL
jgi:hypothetical protein